MINGDKSHGYLPKGIGWYRRKFALTAEDKERDLTLEFGGACKSTRNLLTIVDLRAGQGTDC